jgi:large subunit ribosomal protein L21
MHVRRDPAPILMTYAIVKLGGKQYRVHEGEQLVVDRLAVDESKTFHPEVLLVGGDGKAELSPKGVQVTARVVGHELGKKIIIGKHRRRTGYRRRNGFRAQLSRVEIQTIGKKATRASTAKTEASVETPEPKAAAKPRATSAARPKTTKKAE